MISLKEVMEEHKRLCGEALEIVETKGADYNRSQQKNGDTLFNMRVCQLLGVVDNVTQGILVRLSDKFMRLSSLCKDPLQNPEVKNESVEDTIKDIINYLVYLNLFYTEIRSFSRSPKTNHILEKYKGLDYKS